MMEPKCSELSANWIITGVVDAVDTERGEITLWLDSFDELQTVPIAPAMPVEMLRPEVSFQTKIPRDCAWQQNLTDVVWGEFYIQDKMMSEEELFESAASIFMVNSSEGAE